MCADPHDISSTPVSMSPPSLLSPSRIAAEPVERALKKQIELLQEELTTLRKVLTTERVLSLMLTQGFSACYRLGFTLDLASLPGNPQPCHK